jgi:flagellar basal body-associated protein FliL
VRKKRKKGLWIFLICFALVLVAAVAAFLIHWNRERNRPAGELPERTEMQEISIPAFPTGQGVVLPIEKEPGTVLTTQEVYRQVNPAVVTVMVQLKDRMGVGTGVIFREDGYEDITHSPKNLIIV